MPNITPLASPFPRPNAINDPRGLTASAGSVSQAFDGIHSRASDLKGPYYSSKRHPIQGLNGHARVGGAALTCRELSTLWERSFDAGAPDGNPGNPDYRLFSSVESLQAHAPRDIAAIADSRDLSEARFVDNAEWGRWIADAFRSMEATGRTHRAIQVHSPTHAMAMGLLTKETSGGRSYVVKWYDPNHTNTHRRAQANDPEAFVRLSACDFIDDPKRADRYRMDAGTGSVVFLGDSVPDPARQPVRIDHVDAPTLLHLLQRGLAAGIDRYGELLRERQLDPNEVARLLAVKTDWGLPLFSLAIYRDHGDAIRAYGDILLRAGLDRRRTSELLACKTDCGLPGLHIAMQHDKAAGIRAWGDVFLRCTLDPQDRTDLLSTAGPQGIPGLHMAAGRNNAEAILAYGKILFASAVDAGTLVELLAGKDGLGTPALYAAMHLGRTEAIRAYGTLLAASPTDPVQRMKLLAAMDRNGVPGLAFALMNDHVDAIRAYGTAVASSLPDPSQRSDLLGVIGAHVPAIAGALQHAHPATKQAYFDLVATLT